MKLLPVTINDSAHFTPEGRRLLVSLGAVTPDPLRVAAERWLLDHTGPQTEATLAVRAALGHKTPAAWLEAAKKIRSVH